jgi:SAM-dependent methyltransferase
MTTESVAGRPADQVHDAVRDRYAAAARSVTGGTTASCCGPTDTGCGCGPTSVALEPGLGSRLYSADERDALPEDAVSASLGCGNPFAVADLQPGDRVLDLGSGGGIDVLLSARRVGPTGFAYGVDMTDEMLDLARRNAAAAGAGNVEFLRGHIEDVPLPDAAVDVVISNCVVNLSPDKAAVFREAYRVLAPGGRLGITDVVADDALTPDQRAERGTWVGCIAGALSFAELRRLLTDAGFVDAVVEPTHEVAPGMHSALVRARKPEPGVTGRGWHPEEARTHREV